MTGNAEEYWNKFYDDLAEIFFTDKAYVFKEIAYQAKTMREISQSTGIPYMTVRKYIRWAKEKGYVIVAGTEKVGSVLAEKWLSTFVPEIEDVEKDVTVIKLKIKIWTRRYLCEIACPSRDVCPTYKKLKDSSRDLISYRKVTIDRRFIRSGDTGFCEQATKVKKQ
jgi:hypothetical protein